MKKEKDKNNEKPDNENLNEEKTIAGEQTAEETKDDQKINELQEELNRYKDLLLRKAAEFENYKRRTENEQLNLLKYAAETFIVKLLPVIDDFERSLQYIDNSKDIEAVKAGIHLVYEKFVKLLNEQGVTRIDAVGKPFDVNFHEAVMQQNSELHEPHTVIDEIESGYLYKDRVIRHSRVIVSDEASGAKNNMEE